MKTKRQFYAVNRRRVLENGNTITEIEIMQRCPEVGDGTSEFVLARTVGHAVPGIRARVKVMVAALNAAKGGAR